MEKENTPKGENVSGEASKKEAPVVDTKAAEEAQKKSEEIQEKINKIQELLKDVDTNVISEEVQKLLDQVSALRKEKRRVEEIVEKRKSENIKDVVIERAKKLGVEDEENLNKIFEKVKDSGLGVDDETEKIDAEIKKVIPSLNPEEYWKMKEELSKQKEMVDKSVKENVNSGSPETTPNEGEYSEEVLKYAQEHNLKPEKAQKILQRFSKPTRKIM